MFVTHKFDLIQPYVGKLFCRICTEERNLPKQGKRNAWKNLFKKVEKLKIRMFSFDRVKVALRKYVSLAKLQSRIK